MASYLDRIGAGAVLENPEVLDFDWMPPELVGREPIQRELASKFSTISHPEGAGRAAVSNTHFQPPGPFLNPLSRLLLEKKK